MDSEKHWCPSDGICVQKHMCPCILAPSSGAARWQGEVVPDLVLSGPLASLQGSCWSPRSHLQEECRSQQPRLWTPVCELCLDDRSICSKVSLSCHPLSREPRADDGISNSRNAIFSSDHRCLVWNQLPQWGLCTCKLWLHPLLPPPLA